MPSDFRTPEKEKQMFETCNHMAWVLSWCRRHRQWLRQLPGIGIVIMHGKGGSPTKHVADLAASRSEGYLVPTSTCWSGRRVTMRTSQRRKAGGIRTRATRQRAANCSSPATARAAFALYFGGKHSVDGIVMTQVAASAARSSASSSAAVARPASWSPTARTMKARLLDRKFPRHLPDCRRSQCCLVRSRRRNEQVIATRRT